MEKKVQSLEERNAADKKYNDAHSRYFSLKFNYKYDADLIERLALEDSIQAFVKKCIREHIAAEAERGDIF